MCRSSCSPVRLFMSPDSFFSCQIQYCVDLLYRTKPVSMFTENSLSSFQIFVFGPSCFYDSALLVPSKHSPFVIAEGLCKEDLEYVVISRSGKRLTDASPRMHTRKHTFHYSTSKPLSLCSLFPNQQNRIPRSFGSSIS